MFVGLLAEISDAVQAAYQEVLDEWHPEEPPVTTLLAALGDRIAEDFDYAGAHTMESGDSDLVTAVATGLIRSLSDSNCTT